MSDGILSEPLDLDNAGKRSGMSATPTNVRLGMTLMLSLIHI